MYVYCICIVDMETRKKDGPTLVIGVKNIYELKDGF